VIGLDHELQRWVVEHRVGVLDPIAVWLSRIGTSGLVWIAIGVVLAGLRRQPAPALLVAAGVIVADVVALALKAAVDRPRPYLANPEPEPLMRTPLDFAFPSGHAATAFAGATILSALAPRLAPWLFALAALIAASRVYVGVHYPLDVLGGAVLGTAIGLAAVRMGRARALRWPGAALRGRRRPPRAG
jgi:undecaprenyl-diphosphatase